MTILNVNVVQDNGKIREIGKPRDIHGADFYWRIQVFIGFTNEFIDDFILVNKDRYGQCQKGNTHCQQKIKEDPFESEQSGNSLTK
jgi:ABC-type Fe3+/spermidine/putrescine transport system ATPase subunit